MQNEYLGSRKHGRRDRRGRAAGHFFTDSHGAEPIRGDLFGLDRLVAHARLLATRLRAARVVPGRPLLRHFLANRRSLIHAYREISAAYRRQENFGPDAEWLIDNFHIVAETLFEIRTDLPHGYYQLLPKIQGGPLDGLPRVYALALELVAHCDSCLDEAHIGPFVEAFQTIAPLTIGELWAIPIMLRLVLVDNLRRLAAQILCARDHRRQAKAWADRCLGGGATPPPGRRDWSDSFLVQLMDWMHEQGAGVVRGVEWLEGHLSGCGLTTEAVLRRERQRQAANQVSIGNCVTSLRLLSALDWAAFFERSSVVDAVLREDPAGVYSRQDFATRDRYRQAVEKLSRGSRHDEGEVARQAVALAGRHREQGTGNREQQAASSVPCSLFPVPCVNHVGYYLIDKGRQELQGLLHYRPKLRDRVLDGVRKHPRLTYFGGVAVVTVFVLALLAALLGPWAGGGWLLVLLAVLVALPPASDVAVSLVNYWVGAFVPPRMLPKMLFKEGVPADCAAFVVVPGMLTRPRSAAALLERLEIHYLCNPDPNLYFALLTDFADAPQEHTPEDDAYLRAALDGVRALNDRYAGGGPERFFVFHRRRLWNAGPGLLDGLGTQTRQAVGIQPPAPRRPRHQLRHPQRRPEPGPAHPLCHHPRRRHAAALRRCPPAPRYPGSPAEPAALRPGQGPRRRRLWRVAAARQPDADRRPQIALRPYFRRLGRHRPLHRRSLRRLPGSVRRRQPSPARASTTWTPSRPPSARRSPRTTSSATT